MNKPCLYFVVVLYEQTMLVALYEQTMLVVLYEQTMLVLCCSII